MKNSTELPDMAIAVKKQSQSGIFKNQRVLLIKSGFISYYTNIPKGFKGNPQSLQKSGQFPKMTLSAANISSIERKIKYVHLKFNKKYLINNEKIKGLINQKIKQNQAYMNKDGQQQWVFKCENVNVAQNFLNHILFYKKNPNIKPDLKKFVNEYQDVKFNRKANRTQSMRIDNLSPINAHRLSQQTIIKKKDFQPKQFQDDAPFLLEQESIQKKQYTNPIKQQSQEEEIYEVKEEKKQEEMKQKQPNLQPPKQFIQKQAENQQKKIDKIKHQQKQSHQQFPKTQQKQAVRKSFRNSKNSKNSKNSRSSSNSYTKQKFPYYPYVKKKQNKNQELGGQFQINKLLKPDQELLKRLAVEKEKSRSGQDKSGGKQSKLGKIIREKKSLTLDKSKKQKIDIDIETEPILSKTNSWAELKRKKKLENTNKTQVHPSNYNQSNEQQQKISTSLNNEQRSNNLDKQIVDLKQKQHEKEENQQETIENSILEIHENKNQENYNTECEDKDDGKDKQNKKEEIKIIQETNKQKFVLEEQKQIVIKSQCVEDAKLQNSLKLTQNIIIQVKQQQKINIHKQEDQRVNQTLTKDKKQEELQINEVEKQKISQQQKQIDIKNQNEKHKDSQTLNKQQMGSIINDKVQQIMLETSSQKQKITQIKSEPKLQHQPQSLSESGLILSQPNSSVPSDPPIQQPICYPLLSLPSSILTPPPIVPPSSFPCLKQPEFCELPKILKIQKEPIKIEEVEQVQEIQQLFEIKINTKQLKNQEKQKQKQIEEQNRNYNRIYQIDDRRLNQNQNLEVIKQCENQQSINISFSNLDVAKTQKSQKLSRLLTSRFWDQSQKGLKKTEQPPTRKPQPKHNPPLSNPSSKLNLQLQLKINDKLSFSSQAQIKNEASLLISKLLSNHKQSKISSTLSKILLSNSHFQQISLPLPALEEFLEIEKRNQVKRMGIWGMKKLVDENGKDAQGIDLNGIFYGKRIKIGNWGLYLYQKRQHTQRVCKFYLLAERMLGELNLGNMLKMEQIYSLSYKGKLAVFLKEPSTSYKKMPKVAQSFLQKLFDSELLNFLRDQIKIELDKQQNRLLIWVNPDYLQNWSSRQNSISNPSSKILASEMVKIEPQLLDLSEQQLQTFIHYIYNNLNSSVFLSPQKVANLFQLLNKMTDYYSIELSPRCPSSTPLLCPISISFLCQVRPLFQPPSPFLKKLTFLFNRCICSNSLVNAIKTFLCNSLQILFQNDIEGIKPVGLGKFLKVFLQGARIYLWESKFKEVEHVCGYGIGLVVGEGWETNGEEEMEDKVEAKLQCRMIFQLESQQNNQCIGEFFNSIVITLFQSKIKQALYEKQKNIELKNQQQQIETLFKKLSGLMSLAQHFNKSKNKSSLHCLYQLILNENFTSFLVQIDTELPKLIHCRQKSYILLQQVLGFSAENTNVNTNVNKDNFFKHWFKDQSQFFTFCSIILLNYIDLLIKLQNNQKCLEMLGKFMETSLYHSNENINLNKEVIMELKCRKAICLATKSKDTLFGVEGLNFLFFIDYYARKLNGNKEIQEQEREGKFQNHYFGLRNYKNEVNFVSFLVKVYCEYFACNDDQLCFSLIEIFTKNGLPSALIKQMMVEGLKRLEPGVKRRVQNRLNS